ncbi:hypothetical protein PILCRDRAFT_771075 [Piloderma croceum F 1598]|uniref:DUF6533 domain-containing protein n=1 Tax=Piloderma croceum (strain F 1598) TaxID=765440 RepID=A0A0C3GCB7_PILCF|nr:hypothetical protein PILCRDRAFT_771075 [Piloderma croceum F 1598]
MIIMTSNSTIPLDAILNPYTPLAFLRPEVADPFQIICYGNVATFAAFTWDWLMAIPEEYNIICKAGFSWPNIMYFLSRFGTFGSCLLAMIYRIAPVDDCNALKYVEGMFLEIGVAATSLLFFIRVRAVYNHSRIITASFGLLWLVVVSLHILILLGVKRDRIPYTRRCIEGPAPKYTTVPIILTAVNDTLVFFAISYRMVSLAIASSTWSSRAKSFFMGDGLLNLSKALLQGGQVYYFATIGVAITATALILSPEIPGVLKPILGSVYIALSSTMACRVYRAFLLGVLTDPQMNTATVVSFYRAADNTCDDHTLAHDTLSDRSSKLAINDSVETNLRVEDNNRYALGGRRLTADDVGQDISHRV